jgi:hypothetical protein
LSSKDAHALDAEFRSDAAFLLAQKKRTEYTEFACYVRNFTNEALSVHIPLGYVDALPTMSEAAYQDLIWQIRNEYSAPPMEPTFDLPPAAQRREVAKQPQSAGRPAPQEERAEASSEPASPRTESLPAETSPHDIDRPAAKVVEPLTQPISRAKPIPGQGRGGKQHKYLQHLIKQLAEERQFRASIEETILDGEGRVDVSLLRGERRIACEISVTTNQDHELGNIEKCLAAGYTEVVLVGNNERHIKSLAKFIEGNLDESEQGKVRYVVPEGLIEYLDSVGEPPEPTEQMVRGYKVRTVQQVVDPQEADTRRTAVAEVIARSLSRAKKE